MSRTKKHQHQPQYTNSSLFRLQPYVDQADSLLTSANGLVEIKQFESAYKLLVSILKIDPGNPDALYLQGDLLKRSGHTEKALECFTAASYQMPNNIKLFGRLADIHWQLGNNEAAVSALHKVIELDPKLGKSRITLGALYHSLGMHERGRYWARQGASLEPITFGQKPVEKKLKLLVLRSAESSDWQLDKKSFSPRLIEGHNNLSSLLDASAIEITNFYVDYIDENPEVIRKLPKADVIYNAMTDADRCAEALGKAGKLCKKLGISVMNAPQAVLKTTRQDNYQRFKDNPDIILPESVRVDNVQGECLPHIMAVVEEHGFEPPVIVRVSGFQNGKYTHKVESIEKHDFSEINELLREQPRSLYVSQYCEVGVRDARASDNVIYPKYRAFFVGGELYPIHVRYGYGEWNVHMPQSAPTYKKFPWLYDLARNYLEDPLSHFDEKLWLSLKEVMSSLELDYVGVDFALSTAPGKEGKLVIFEANASMRSFLLDTHRFVPEHEAARRVILAAHDVMANKAGVERWEYQIPKGKTSPGEKWLVSEGETVTVEVKVTGDTFDSGFGEWLWHECYKHHLNAKISHDNGRVEGFFVGGRIVGVEALLVAMSQWCEKDYQFSNSQCEEVIERGVRFI